MKTLLLQRTEYKSRNSSRNVKMPLFPPNSPISARLMSNPYEEMNVTESILPHSAQDVCPHTAIFPACNSSSPGIFYVSKIMKWRGNHVLRRAASIPLARLLKRLTLQEYFSFNLPPWCHKHCSSNLFLSRSHKNYPLYVSKSRKISTFDHLFLRPCLSLSWLQTHRQFMTVHGGFSFLACLWKIPTSHLHTNLSPCLSRVCRNKSKVAFSKMGFISHWVYEMLLGMPQIKYFVVKQV